MIAAVSATEVIVYGRPGCHLCDDALVVIERVRTRLGFELQQVDIEADEELFKRYLERIPVVEVNGVEAFEFFVDERELERVIAQALARAKPRPPHSRVNRL